MPPYYGLKVSDKPLTEWHAFATIPEPDGKGFSFVVSKAGDWTTKTINEPPKKLWTRGFPVHGPLYGARLFRQIVVVATGSGIGPCMSLFVDNKIPRRILWSTRDPEKTYGAGIIDAVKKADPNAVIWNTSEKGYPDVVMETYRLYVESGAEAVYVISNPKVTRKVQFGLESRGIAVYGPIFDS
jgi:NAD(P)H-flavin reductase